MSGTNASEKLRMDITTRSAKDMREFMVVFIVTKQSEGICRKLSACYHRSSAESIILFSFCQTKSETIMCKIPACGKILMYPYAR
jgi:hypothetical protein